MDLLHAAIKACEDNDDDYKMDVCNETGLQDAKNIVDKDEVIAKYILELKNEINDQEGFDYFLETFSDFTNYKIGWQEYQEDAKEFVPAHLYWMVNRLIRTVVEAVEDKMNVRSEEELVHKVPKLKIQMEEDETRAIPTKKPEQKVALPSLQSLLDTHTPAQLPSQQAFSTNSSMMNGNSSAYPAWYAMGYPFFRRPTATPSPQPSSPTFPTPPVAGPSESHNRAQTSPTTSHASSQPNNFDSIERLLQADQMTRTEAPLSPTQARIMQEMAIFTRNSEQLRKITVESEPESPSPAESEDGEDYEEDYESQKKKSKKSKGSNKKKTRIRNEWTVDEDRIFLQGLQRYGADFNSIAKLLPNRSRYQIRTHYTYLAKNIMANERVAGTGEAPVRRIKTRGRPPKSGEASYMPNELMQQLTDCISKIENGSKQPPPSDKPKSPVPAWRHSI